MRGAPVTLDDFRGGVNTDAGVYNLKNNEARGALNVQATSRGAIRKRDGSQLFGYLAVPLTNLYASSSPRVLIGSAGENIYGVTPGVLINNIGSGHVADSMWNWIQAPVNGGEGPFFGLNRHVLRSWTGSGFAQMWTPAAGTIPVGQYIKYHGNRVWIANTAADPSGLYFSNIGNPRDWPAPNVVRFDPSDGEEITGLGTAGPYLLVFKPSKIWLVTDLDTGANRLISRNAGCIAPRSIVETPEGTFFLTPDQGIMVANQNNTQLLSNNQRLSDAILPTISELPQATLRHAAGAYFDQHYYLSVSSGGITNDLMLDYDMVLRSWWLHSHGMAALAVWERTADEPELYGAVAGVPRIDRLFVPNEALDAGTIFPAYWTSPFLTFGKPMVRKRCREIHFDGEGRINVKLAKDFSLTAAEATSANFAGDDGTYGGPGGLFGVDDGSVFGSAVLVGEANVYTPGVARAWSVMFGNDTADTFVIDSFSLMMQERTE